MTDIFKKRRLTQITLVLLVILNLALITTMLINKPPRRGGGTPQQGIEAFLKEELQLSDKQALAFQDIRKDHFESLKPKLDSLTDSLETLINAAFNSDVDSARIDELTLNLAAIHVEMDKALYAHFSQLNQICTPDQQTRLRELAGELMQGGRQPPPPEGQNEAGRPPHPDAPGRDRRPPPPGMSQRPGGPPAHDR